MELEARHYGSTCERLSRAFARDAGTHLKPLVASRAQLPQPPPVSYLLFAMSERLTQVSGHLSNTYSSGLLNGEVAIITGKEILVLLFYSLFQRGSWTLLQQALHKG